MYISQYIQPHEWRNIKKITVLAEGRTNRQPYQIVELAHYGKAMVINGCIQSTEVDESYYHEALIYPAVMLHGEVKRVICFGGANGGILKRLAHLPQVEEIIQIDIDEELYHISRQFLPHMHSDMPENVQFNLIFDDPILWLKNNCTAYSNWADLIICDLPDATQDSYAPWLFTSEFYGDIVKILAPDGIFVTQAGQGHVFAMEFHCRVMATLRQFFSEAVSYSHFVPSIGVPWAFALASRDSKRVNVPTEILKKRIETLSKANLYSYDFITHEHMFNLPKLFREKLTKKYNPIKVKKLEYVKIVSHK